MTELMKIENKLCMVVVAIVDCDEKEEKSEN
jgi:hypothetical protein